MRKGVLNSKWRGLLVPRIQMPALAFGALLTAGLPTRSFAQFDNFTMANPKPWEALLGASKAKVQPTFTNVPVDRIFSYYQNVSGITIVRDPALVGTMTIASAKPVTLSQAFDILSASLTLRGFEISSKDNMLVVKKKAAARAQGGPALPGRGGMTVGPGQAPGQFPEPGGPQQETLVLRVYRVKFANASTASSHR